MSERNKATIRRIREEAVGRSGADLAFLDALYAPNYQYHGGAWGELKGADAFRGLLEGLAGALEGYRETVLHQVAEGDTVVTRLKGRGRALADLPGITGGSEFTGDALSWARFDEQGRVAEEWTYTGEMKPI